MNGQPDIFLGQPLYGRDADCGALMAATIHASNVNRPVAYARFGGSSLPHVFNNLWIQALSAPEFHSHFAMLHGDIEPESGWLDVLWDEMERTKATVMSAVVAIKDDKGCTSTGIGNPDDEFDYRRLTTTEIQNLPKTFNLDAVENAGIWPVGATEGKCLLVNTGCWLADLRWPGWRQLDENGFLKFKFEQKHRVQRWPNGRWNSEFAPEDWLMSRYVAKHGGSVYATRAIKTIHVGSRLFPNWLAWGDATDAEIDRHQASRRESFAASVCDESGSCVAASELQEAVT